MGLIVKFITVGFIVKDLLSYFCKHSISPMTVEEIPGQYLSLKAFKITKFALRYIHPPIYFKLPLNCNVNATVVILFSSESNCKNNILSAFTHFFFQLTLLLGWFYWNGAHRYGDQTITVIYDVWNDDLKELPCSTVTLNFTQRRSYSYRRISPIFLFCQESCFVDSIVSVLSPISTFQALSTVCICNGYGRYYH